MKHENVHSKASQVKKLSLKYFYAIILLITVSNESVLACHHLGQTSNVESTIIGISKFSTQSYSKVFLGTSRLISIDQTVPYSNSGHKKYSVKDLQEKIDHTTSTSLYSHFKVDSKYTTNELDCCINHSTGCTNNNLCECSHNTQNDLHYNQLNPKQGLSISLHSVIDISTNKKGSIGLIVTYNLIPHPSYFSLYESWLI